MTVTKDSRLHPYAQYAVQAILIVGFAGIVACILGIGAAFVYWAWTA